MSEEYMELDERATAPAPLTMEALDEAFDSGKVSPACKAGDIVITREREGWYTIVERRSGGDLSVGHQRILAIAPEPEPWQGLADILLEDGLAYEEDIEGIVKRLYERGVRVTGDGEH